MTQFHRFLVVAAGLFVCLNLGGLWAVTLLKQQKEQAFEAHLAEAKAHSAEVKTLTSEVAQLKSQVTALQNQDDQVGSSPAPNSTAVPRKSELPTTAPVTAPAAAPKEQIIFIGTGSTTERDWTTMTGATVSLNRDLYPQIKQVAFEASLAIVGGEAQARLVNTQTGAIIDTSAVSNNTPNAVWKRSTAFNLFPGTATYAVQLRSTSGDVAKLEGSRLIIVTQ